MLGYIFFSKISIQSEKSLEIYHFLQYCKNKNIVIGFIPPFPDRVNDKLLSSGHYTYLKYIPQACQKFFKKYDFELYDLSSVKLYNSNDSEAIDGFHGGELGYLKMLIEMLKKNSRLNEVTSIQRLEIESTQPLNRYQVYEY